MKRAPKPKAEASLEKPASAEAQLAEARAANDRLAAELAALRTRLQIASEGASFKCGTLYKYRPWAEGVFKDAWVKRFFVLLGGTLASYLDEASASLALLPRSTLSLDAACVCAPEGWKKRRFWAFAVTDGASGARLLRLSALSEAEGLSWVAALAAAGARRAPPRAAGFFGPQPPLTPLRAMARGPLLAAPRLAQQAAGSASAGSGHEEEEEDAPPQPQPQPQQPQQLRRRPQPQQQQQQQQQAQQPRAAAAPAPQPQPGAPDHTSPSCAVHREPRASPMSSEALLYSSHAGLVNLAAIVLAVNHARLVLENLARYGVRVRASFWASALGLVGWGWGWGGGGGAGTGIGSPPAPPPPSPPLLLITALAWPPLCFAAALGIERAAAAAGGGRWAGRLAAAAGAAVAAAATALPVRVILASPRSEPLPGFMLLSASVVGSMKLVSWFHANADLRSRWALAARGAAAAARKGRAAAAAAEDADASSSGGGDAAAGGGGGGGGRGGGGGGGEDAYALAYPANLTPSNIAYFALAPTLCYQPSYPRWPAAVRPRWLARRCAELALCGGLAALIIEQYMLPALASSSALLAASRGPGGAPPDPVRLAERLLKLSIPTLYVWLACFYAFFHCWLNILAELLRFGDRGFYKEWWNAATVEELWNLPVHKWLARHLYFPAMRLGLSRGQAMLLTFAFSAVAHELLVGVPCHLLRGWAFAGIMLQVPLIALTNWTARKLRNEQWGNTIFWLSFCIVGQPAAVVLYYSAYQQRKAAAAAVSA